MLCPAHTTTLQVLSQLELVYSIPFPDLYASLLRWVGMLELNFVDMLPLGCVVKFSFHSKLLLRTMLLPAFALVPLALFKCRLCANKKWRATLTGGLDACRMPRLKWLEFEEAKASTDSSFLPILHKRAVEGNP